MPAQTTGSVIATTSRGLGWNGLVAESGHSPAWASDHLTLGGHLVGVNLGESPVAVERKGARGFVRDTIAPGAVWIYPAFEPIVQRSAALSWGAVELSLPLVRRALGGELEPRGGLGVTDAPLAAMVRALLDELRTGGESGPLYVDGIALAIVARLARRAGADDAAASPAGILTARRLRDVIDKIEASLCGGVTVDELAGVVQLSPAHFAREFKRCTHESPHAFVLRRRLERAQRMLAAGRLIADTAIECGFTDQAHLSRAFKKRFGVTPGAFVRSVRGVASR